MPPTILTVQRDALLPVLERAAGVIASRTSIDILQHLRLRAEGESLHITGTDLEITVEASLPAQIEGAPLAFTAPGGMLHDIVKKLAEGAAVRIEAERGGQMVVKAGRSRFTLHTLSAEDFPDLPEREILHRFTLPRKTIEVLLARVAFAASTDEARYYLNGVFWHVEDGNLVSVATDGHRLALMRAPAPEGASGMPGTIIPRDTAGEILKLLKGSKEDEVAIGVSPFAITLAIGATRLTSKLIDGTFPDYQRVIPRRNDKVANAERDDLLRAADRVSTISSERARAVRLRFSEDALELAVTNPDAGSSSDEVEIDYAGTPVEIGFNARYFADALGAIEGDVVKIALFDAGSPVLITSAAEDRFLTVLMPMRV